LKSFSLSGPAWFSLLFWVCVYGFGAHPDVTWGDGLGYLDSVESGFDFGTNANSHFLYLFFCRVFCVVIPWLSAQNLMAMVSIFWAILVLSWVYLIGKKWKDETTGLFSMQVIACTFTFWRHACIIEVYSMELAFWVLCFWFLLRFLEENKAGYFYGMAFFHALGLLVHIHLVLFFPVYLYFLVKRKPVPFSGFAFYFIPVLVVFVSVYFLKTNSFSEVFFDSIGAKMTEFDFIKILKGPFVVIALLVFAMPFSWLLLCFCIKELKTTAFELSGDAFFQALLPVLLFVFGFAVVYAEPGIHVFLLPFMLFLALAFGRIFALKFTKPRWIFAFPAFHTALILGVFVFYKSFIYRPDILVEMKGGPGYLFLPWARGNASSVLETAAKNDLKDVPEEIKWNVEQAKRYLAKKNPTN
jgi:hypothetical protein